MATSLLGGFVAGVAYRILMDPAEERTLANFLRSGIHGVGITLTVWLVQTGFASGARSRLGVDPAAPAACGRGRRSGGRR